MSGCWGHSEVEREVPKLEWIKNSNYTVLNWISGSGGWVNYLGGSNNDRAHRGTRGGGHTSLSETQNTFLTIVQCICSILYPCQESCPHTMVEAIVYIFL